MGTGFIYEITGRCNLACAFCYNAWHGHEGSHPPAALEVEDACAVLDRALLDSGASWLTFTGGEPLLHEGLERVMTHVHGRFPGVQLGLATNGVLLDAPRMERLQAAGLSYVEISFRAQNEHHDRPAQALALARARGLSPTAAAVLHAGMENRLEDLICVAYALGADRMALNRFVARGLGARNQEALMPSLDELDRMLVLADRLGEELGFPIAVTTPIEACLLPHQRYPHLAFSPCVCGETKWAIDPQGNLRTCELSEEILGSLKQATFTDLSRDPRVHRFRSAHKHEPCTECPSLPQCGGGCRFT